MYNCVAYTTSNGRQEMVTIPSVWYNLVENEFYWPDCLDSSKVRKTYQNFTLPKETWKRFPNARILHTGIYFAF